LPEPVDQEFLRVVREVLSGLVAVSVTTEQLRDALLRGGSPVSPDEFKHRFESYLEGLVRGKQRDKVRIVVE